jgi:rhodanese-related sulfurtransferase
MKPQIPLFAALLATALLGGCGDGVQFDSSLKAATLAQTIAKGEDHVSVEELADWLIKDQRDFELVDIREQEDFAASHIEGAHHIPLAKLFSESSLASLPVGRKIVVYSNGSAHAAQAALLLDLSGRNALALLGGFNYWQDYLHDPKKAGVAEMDPARRAHYQAVSCYFAGEYVADAGLPSKAAAREGVRKPTETEDSDPLGLGLGLGTEQIQTMELKETTPEPEPSVDDPLGLGLGLGLGGDAAKELNKPAQPKPGESRKLLIREEC